MAAASIAAGPQDAGGVTIAGIVGLVGLACSLVRGWHSVVTPAVGLIALTAVAANQSTYALVPVEAGALVAIALLAWWSIDERLAVVGDGHVDGGRARTSLALVIAAGGLSALVVAMASAASTALVGPAVGAAGLASIAAALWSVARLRRYQEEQPAEPVR